MNNSNFSKLVPAGLLDAVRKTIQTNESVPTIALGSDKPIKNDVRREVVNEIAVMNSGLLTHSLRSAGARRNASSPQPKKLTDAEKAEKAKAASDWKVKQAFDKLKPQAASDAKKVRQTTRTGLFGRKLKDKESDFRHVPAKKARPDLQFEEVEISELSNKTLSSYIKKASQEVGHGAYKAGEMSSRPGIKSYHKKALAKVNKRMWGVVDAANRINKREVSEDQELNERDYRYDRQKYTVTKRGGNGDDGLLAKLVRGLVRMNSKKLTINRRDLERDANDHRINEEAISVMDELNDIGLLETCIGFTDDQIDELLEEIYEEQ